MSKKKKQFQSGAEVTARNRCWSKRRRYRRVRFEHFEQRFVLTAIPFASAELIQMLPQYTFDAVLADLDRDADLDILTADDGVVAYENTDGLGSFGAPQTIVDSPADLTHEFHIDVADLNNDGAVDVVYTDNRSQSVAWHAGNGLGGFGAAQNIDNSAGNRDDAVFTADLDRDGDLDVLTAGARVVWYENDGAGSFGAAQTIDSSLTAGVTMAIADLDRNGSPDVIVGDQGANQVLWYANDGTPGDGGWTAHVLVSGVDAAEVVASDIDRDGDMDVVAADQSGNRAVWMENDGMPADDVADWTLQTVGTSAQSHSISVRDVDGDGDPDVLLATFVDNNGTVSWYENDGAGTFASSHVLASTVDQATSVRAGDIDGDGDWDAISVEYGGSNLYLHRNEWIHRSALFGSEHIVNIADPDGAGSGVEGNADGAVSVFASDLDGDGDLDLVSASESDDRIAWYENVDGQGTFGPQQTVNVADDDGDPGNGNNGDTDEPQFFIYAYLYLHVNQDIISLSFRQSIAWHENRLNEPSNDFGPRDSIGGDRIRSIFATDADGDGDLDLISAGDFSFINWWENRLNEPSADFDEHLISSSAIQAYSAFAADLDGDGDQDVLSASWFDDKVAWYENRLREPQHDFTSEKLVNNPNTGGGFGDIDGPQTVFAADLDEDGDMDVISAGRYDFQIVWYENRLNEPLAGFAEKQPVGTADATRNVYVADMDGDGDADVVSASLNDDKIAWYENRLTEAAAEFGPEHLISDRADSARAVIVSDLDRDGDADVVSASFHDDKIAWYENRGGQYAMTTTDAAGPLAFILNGEVDDVLRIDAVHRGRPGDHDIELATLALLLEESAGDPLSTNEANMLIENLLVYRDDGDQIFDPDSDALVEQVSTLVLTGGLLTVPITDNNANARFAIGAPATFFVAAELTSDAAAQAVDRFRITHVTVPPSQSTAEDQEADLPVRLEFVENVASSSVRAASGLLAYDIPAGANQDDLVLRLNGPNVEVVVADTGTAVIVQPLAETTSVMINGADSDNNHLTVDFDFGGFFELTGGIQFSGGQAGEDSLAVIGDGATLAGYMPASNSGDGTVTIQSGGRTTQINFTDMDDASGVGDRSLELSQMTSVTLTTPNSSDAISIVERTGPTGEQAWEISGQSDTVAIEPLTIFDVATLNIDTGSGDQLPNDIDQIVLDVAAGPQGLFGFVGITGSGADTMDTLSNDLTFAASISFGDAADRMLINGNSLDIGGLDVPGTLAGNGFVYSDGNLNVGRFQAGGGIVDEVGPFDFGGRNAVALSVGLAQLGSFTTIDGGTIQVPRGLLLHHGNSVVGNGAIAGHIVGLAGSTVDADGDLVLGDAQSFRGFESDGELYIFDHTVTINDRDQAVLPALTEVGEGTNPGTLVAANGSLLESGKTLAGVGTIDGEFENNGFVHGDGAGITFNDLYRGSGDWGGTVTFLGGMAPGNSPAQVTGFGDTHFGEATTVFLEIGGSMPGGEFDQITVTGHVELNGELNVSSIDLDNGFAFALGQSFEVLKFTTRDGDFSSYSGLEVSPGLRLEPSFTPTSLELTVVPSEPIVGRHIFYNDTAFDGNDPAANENDDAAMATNKSPLLPGNTATFENYISGPGGITGVMIDVDGLSSPPAIHDFTFRIGNDNNPVGWSVAAAPTLTYRPGAGDGGSGRIVLTWADGSIVGQWLQVTMNENADINLPADVFYIGSAPGESGDRRGVNTLVNGLDFAGARDNPRGNPPGAAIDNTYDFNRDGLIDGTDMAIVRDNVTNFQTALRLITPTTPPPTAMLIAAEVGVEPLSSVVPEQLGQQSYKSAQPCDSRCGPQTPSPMLTGRGRYGSQWHRATMATTASSMQPAIDSFEPLCDELLQLLAEAAP